MEVILDSVCILRSRTLNGFGATVAKVIRLVGVGVGGASGGLGAGGLRIGAWRLLRSRERSRERCSKRQLSGPRTLLSGNVLYRTGRRYQVNLRSGLTVTAAMNVYEWYWGPHAATCH